MPGYYLDGEAAKDCLLAGVEWADYVRYREAVKEYYEPKPLAQDRAWTPKRTRRTT